MDRIELMEEEYQDQADTTALGMYCRDLYEEYKNSSYRNRKLDEIADGRKRYSNDRPAKTFPWKNASNKSLGLEAIAVDNLEPRIINRLIAEDDFIQPEPTGAEDVANVEGVKEFMHWACHNNMKIKSQIKPIIHDLLMDGTKFVLPIWTEKERTVKVRQKQPVFNNRYTGEREDIPREYIDQLGPPQQALQHLMQYGIVPAGAEDGITEKTESEFKVEIEALKTEECFFPDHNDDWEEQPFARFIYPTLGELVELSEGDGPYYNIDNDLVAGRRRETTDDEQRKEISYSLYTQECQLIEWHVKWEGEWRIATFSIDAGWREVRNQLVTDVYWHGHKPVRRFRIYPESNESMGVGIPKKIEQLSKGVNDLFNQMIDIGTMEVVPTFFYNKSATGMGNLDLKLFPGKGIGIPKDSNVYFPNSGVKSTLFIEFINLLMAFFERTLSLMDYSAGTRSQTSGMGGDTAAGMNMILQEGNIHHNYTGEILQDTFGELLTDVLSIYVQNLPAGAKQRIFENNEWVFKDIDVYSIQGKFDIRIEVSDASANTMTNRNEKLTLAKVMGANPVLNQARLADDVLKAFGIKDTREYIKQEFQMIMQALQQAPELPQVIQQYMQQKGQQADEQQIRQQAEHNIKRQAIQREVESPHENRKIVDQANEKFKRKIVGEVIDRMGGLGEPMPQQQAVANG